MGPLAQHQPTVLYLGDPLPTEFEAAFYDARRTDQTLVEIQQPRVSIRSSAVHLPRRQHHLLWNPCGATNTVRKLS